jgi:putative hemin transport protein
VVTSLELLDENGGVIAQFFGARKPGKPELEEWRGLLKML